MRSRRKKRSTGSTPLLILAGALLAAAAGPAGCDDPKSRCIGNEGERPTQAKAPPRPATPEEIDTLPVDALTVGQARAKLTETGDMKVAGVLARDIKKAIECLSKQHEHGHSCPPPYHILGDTAPFDSIPERMGPRMLVKIRPVPKGLKVGEAYLMSGHWCHAGKVALFCANRLYHLPRKEGQELWEKRVEPNLPPVRRKASRTSTENEHSKAR